MTFTVTSYPGNRYANIEAAQADILEQQAQAIARAIKAHLSSGTLAITNGTISYPCGIMMVKETVKEELDCVKV